MILKPNVDRLRLIFSHFAHKIPGDVTPLKDILMVGATLDNGHLSQIDKRHLRLVLRELHRLGAPVAADFQASVMNYRHDQGGGDFLSAPPPSDILVCSYIFNPVDRERDEYIPLAGAQNENRSLSPFHFEPDAWLNAARASGARVVATIGGRREINAGHFLGAHFSLRSSRKCGPYNCDYAILKARSPS